MWFQTPRQALDRRPARTPGPGWHQGWPQGCQAILSAKARAASDPTRTKEDPSSLVHGALGAAHPRLWGPPSAHKAAAWNSTARQVRGGGQRSADSRLFSNFLGAGGGAFLSALFFCCSSRGESRFFQPLLDVPRASVVVGVVQGLTCLGHTTCTCSTAVGLRPSRWAPPSRGRVGRSLVPGSMTEHGSPHSCRAPPLLLPFPTLQPPRPPAQDLRPSRLRCPLLRVQPSSAPVAHPGGTGSFSLRLAGPHANGPPSLQLRHSDYTHGTQPVVSRSRSF